MSLANIDGNCIGILFHDYWLILIGVHQLCAV